ncbi:MBL fold metallo-hydrolase [Dictyobacter arantiisoli]|uniref:MBL fold metallo-hydrolase n=1 Tax=Dictyobacter arantiisoli TaxID=2014874 RepID=A0A5A5TCU2_9CHLR|nr:MBL fold metallo-hydrolase [Dictyobacter arantiisoli]GCF09015.1 MBL fold metallo-hydrolase [Dictyobacter arantiisoli]
MANVEESRFLIRFWGVRGSYPTPGPGTLRHGGNTACVEIQAGEHTLIFDAGSGIIGLGASLMQQLQGSATRYLSLFITHGHGDHLQGFPFFSPLFDPRINLHLFGPQLADQNIEELLVPLMSPPYFPVDVRHLPSQRAFHTIEDTQCIRWLHGESEPTLFPRTPSLSVAQGGETRVIACFTHSHPLNGAIIYRIEHAGHSVVYATDVEWSDGCDPVILDFIAGADVLIHDAQYTTADYQQMKHGFGHSTVTMALDVARSARVKQLILFHHEPTYNDDQLDTMEAEACASFARTRSAYEGMEIDLLA